jgi:hypothetical protein
VNAEGPLVAVEAAAAAGCRRVVVTSSAKAKRELGYRSRPLDQTLRATIAWYMDLIEHRAFENANRSSLSTLAAGTRALSTLGPLAPFKLGQRITGRRLIAGV